MRPEIQALRAVAVLLVLVFHAWPSALPGGFVGVDVFFVVSGFLITSHLLREVDRTGRVALGAFWARRARRILPAASFVLLVCALATLWLVPVVYWEQFFAEIRASILYVENWHLSAAAVDYLAADDRPSPVQHFWSLSAEEQFYLAWPVLILGALAATRRRSGIAIVLFTVTALSFAYSMWATATNPAVAYFVTPARAWEFGAGGLLALWPAAATSPGRARSAISWLGFGAIAVAGVAYSVDTRFPGHAALLPVLGAIAVMWAAVPAAAVRLAPVQFLGDVSYSVYLWHWPLLILLPFALGSALDTTATVTALALTILLGWLTKVLVEDPARSGVFMRRPARYSFGLAAIGTVVVLGVTAAGTANLDNQVRAAERATERVLRNQPPCFGAQALDPRRRCDDTRLGLAVAPSPVEAPNLPNAPCTRVERGRMINVCAFGARKAKAVRTVALIGDSHASHWRAALDVVADARRWRGLSIAHTNCPLSQAIRDLPEPERSECIEWNSEVRAWLGRHREVRTIVVAQSSGGAVLSPPGQNQFETGVAGYTDAWNALPRSVERIVVIRDTPRMLTGGRTLACVERAVARRRAPGRACARPRGRALAPDPAFEAARRLPSGRVRPVDLTRRFCDRRLCYPVIGGALVYKDVSHITAVYGTTLGRYLGRAL